MGDSVVVLNVPGWGGASDSEGRRWHLSHRVMRFMRQERGTLNRRGCVRGQRRRHWSHPARERAAGVQSETDPKDRPVVGKGLGTFVQKVTGSPRSGVCAESVRREGEGTGRWARLCDLHPVWDRLSRLECEQWTVETSTLINLNVKRPMGTVMEKRREVGGPEEDEIYRNCRLLVLQGIRGRKQGKERSRGPASPRFVLASPAPPAPLPLCPPAPSSPPHPAWEIGRASCRERV